MLAPTLLPLVEFSRECAVGQCLKVLLHARIKKPVQSDLKTHSPATGISREETPLKQADQDAGLAWPSESALAEGA